MTRYGNEARVEEASIEETALPEQVCKCRRKADLYSIFILVCANLSCLFSPLRFYNIPFFPTEIEEMF